MRSLRLALQAMLITLFISFAASVGARTTTAASSSGYTQTRYPIVLVHGLFGFDQLFGTIDYFYGITDGLRSGGATVYAVELSQLGNDVTRGNQLIAQLENLQAVYGYSKFNLIGHSQGGLDVRYAAAVRPDLVASVSTFGTPHTGSAVADGIATLAPPGSAQRALAVAFATALGNLIDTFSGGNNPQNALDALSQLTTSGTAQFNAQFPAGMPTSSCGSGAAVVNGIRYYSSGGTSVLTNVLDPSDLLLGAGSLFFSGSANDGLVGQCSSHWGTVIRDNYDWNHLDEVNQLLGLRGVFSSDPVAVYRDQANRLKGLGL
ncbi:triacylglycerol lipase [Rhodanobacter sp. A1T4]|uniref:lipase family alpha/beta hydrolase n=1 Tax=Rhodanobacter sp. A1T4 TaxID=2723087 RepID=UPI0017EE957B|nr:triacylglycerol lipase [Rhodanobacter sp. A1T4]MBB6245435.1 triacylglycerol lipase [Rhodanobacter sp. A1T4]